MNIGSCSGTALHYAADNGYEKCVKLLLEAGADVNGSPKTLIVSACRGSEGCLKRLMRSAVLMDICSCSVTALHYAAKEGHASCIDWLLQAGADVNSLNTDHRNPLMIAAINNRLESVKLLFKAGAEVRITNYRGFSALQSYVLKYESGGRSEVDTHGSIASRCGRKKGRNK